MRQGAQGWCTGMTLRDGMGREVRGGIGMGNSCTPRFRAGNNGFAKIYKPVGFLSCMGY